MSTSSAPAALGREDFLDCIHCGFCLEACPTYRETFEEGLSARGRIEVLKALALESLPGERAAAAALDLCLLCRSCESACPSGVRYGDLVTRARDRLEVLRPTGRHRSALRFILRLFKHPRQLSFTLRTIRLAARSGFAQAGVKVFFPRIHHAHYLDLLSAIAHQPRSAQVRLRPVRRSSARREVGTARMSDSGAGSETLIFSGCVTPVFFPQVLGALVSVLRKAGLRAELPAGQVCCGALHLHHGDLEGARALARRNIAAFEAAGVGVILAEAAGCGAMLKEYGALLAQDAQFAERARHFAGRVRDASEYLAQLVAQGQPGTLEAVADAGEPASEQVHTVVYQDACHLRHAQGISVEPRALLDCLPGVRRAETPEEDLCCGSAGIYNLLWPSMAARLGQRKANALAASGAETVVTVNPGCRLQLEARLGRHGLRMRHLVEICDEHWPGGGEALP